MTNPYASRALLQFHTACLHMITMSDRAPLEINNASGAEGLFTTCTGPFSPSTLAKQFTDRSAAFLEVSRNDLEGEDAETLGLIQLAIDEDILPALSVAQQDWDEATRLIRHATFHPEDRDALFEMGMAMDDALNGLNSARDAIAMDIVSNTHFLLRNLGVKLGY